MRDQTSAKPGAAGADLDPEIRRFVQSMSASWAEHPVLDSLSPAEARKVAEIVRGPWARGGPAMHRTSEQLLAFDAAKVRVRVHEPIAGENRPALIYLHGGGWTLFSIDTHDRVMREYAHRAQMVVIAVDYSLSPEAKFPRALREIVSVVQWLRRHGRTWGVDPDRLVIAGDSAGGNLAITAALALREEGAGDALRGMLLNYGVFDSSCDYPSYRTFGGAGYMLGDAEMESFWRTYLAHDVDAENPLASPLRAQLEELPSAFLAVAECDVLRDENLAMAARLHEAGVPTVAKVYPGASHSFLEAVSISAVADRAFDDAAQWLKSVSQPTGTGSGSPSGRRTSP